MTAFLSLYLISHNCKYPKASTSPQLIHSTFVSITPHFPHLHHSVTVWLFLDFSRVLRISCSLSKQTSFTPKLTGSYWNFTTATLPCFWNNCYLFVVNLKLEENIYFRKLMNWIERQYCQTNTFFNEGELFWFHIQTYAFTIHIIHEAVSDLRNASSNCSA